MTWLATIQNRLDEGQCAERQLRDPTHIGRANSFRSYILLGYPVDPDVQKLLQRNLPAIALIAVLSIRSRGGNQRPTHRRRR